ncbi:MAG: hypothetical protein JWM19_3567 [Actinomycetia bacterium]|nr:hypothetical protein [Actinomycetes bacterium]
MAFRLSALGWRGDAALRGAESLGCAGGRGRAGAGPTVRGSGRRKLGMVQNAESGTRWQ